MKERLLFYGIDMNCTGVPEGNRVQFPPVIDPVSASPLLPDREFTAMRTLQAFQCLACLGVEERLLAPFPQVTRRRNVGRFPTQDAAKGVKSMQPQDTSPHSDKTGLYELPFRSGNRYCIMIHEAPHTLLYILPLQDAIMGVDFPYTNEINPAIKLNAAMTTQTVATPMSGIRYAPTTDAPTADPARSVP